uniref:Uncharacterized protein n=1 Tax=Coturnix japonica TaxID=93934 RepID=A0A8C2TTR8_COTJA
VTSCPPPSCPCPPWRPVRPTTPWRSGWPRCWGPPRAGSPTRSAGTRGPASRRSHPPPPSPWWARRCPWPCCCPHRPHPPAICSSSVMLLRSGSPARPNSCWVMVIFSRASSESMGTTATLTAWPGANSAALAQTAHTASRTQPPSLDTPPLPNPDGEFQCEPREAPAWSCSHPAPTSCSVL